MKLLGFGDLRLGGGDDDEDQVKKKGYKEVNDGLVRLVFAQTHDKFGASIAPSLPNGDDSSATSPRRARAGSLVAASGSGSVAQHDHDAQGTWWEAL